MLILICIASANAEMPRYETKYYILYTDITPAEANVVALRMNKMAEEYHLRTRDFSGDIRQKLPFYLYRHMDDYLAAGGRPGSAGQFVEGDALYAVAGEQLDDRSWHVIQHEGFHQFAQAVMGGYRPVWLNEAIAEYFGEALFTGDGFVDGVIPPWRLKRLKKEIQGDELMSFGRIMAMSGQEWGDKIAAANYDQAWSMFQFLAHGENDKYQHPLAAMMAELSKANPYLAQDQQAQKAWNDHFGSTEGFEAQWKKYWLALPENPTADLYAQATVARLTSFLARATAQKQTFASYEDFRAAAGSGKLKIVPTDWLPPDLLVTALADADDLIKSGAQFTLAGKPPSPQIQCTLKDGAHHGLVSTSRRPGCPRRCEDRLAKIEDTCRQRPPSNTHRRPPPRRVLVS